MPLDLKTINDLYRIAVKIATVAHEDGISEEIKEKLLTLAKDVGHISSELSKEPLRNLIYLQSSEKR